MAEDYTHEQGITRAERQRQADRASKFKYQTQYALTVECGSEASQKALFEQLTRQLPNHRIRVVVA